MKAKILTFLFVVFSLCFIRQVKATPQYFDNSTNSTLVGTAVEHRLRWTDNVGLSGYIFSFDNGIDSFVNDSFKGFYRVSGVDGWAYRKNITINNSANSNTLTNYQVFINVTYDSDMQPDFADLRFTYYNSTDNTETEIDYWIEENVSGSYANVWIEMPSIRANVYETVYMYYGNPYATYDNTVGGSNTFIFFDDFNAATLNASKWGSTGSGVSISSNRLRISNTLGNSLVYSQNSFTITNYVLEYFLYAVTNGRYIHTGWTNTTAIVTSTDKHVGFSQQFIGILHWQWINKSTINYGGTQAINAGDVFSLTITFNGSTAKWYINDSLYKTQNNLVMLPDVMRLNFQAAGYPAGYTNTKEYDDIRVRKYTSPEPTYSISSEESPAVAWSNVTKTVQDDTPKYWDVSSTSTVAGSSVGFRIRWTDPVGLSGYIFSFDNCLGTFQNDSWTKWSETEDIRWRVYANDTSNNWNASDVYSYVTPDPLNIWSNVTKAINSTLDCTIRWKVYANDTSNNWNTSSEYSFTTTSATITINLTSYRVWWNDSVTSYGKATANANINITVSNIRCNNVSDSNGDWSCRFNAPSEIGTYTVNARIGALFINTTTLAVKPKYGETPIGTTDRVVYEQPMLIQEPSGKIRIVWTRIMVWRG